MNRVRVTLILPALVVASTTGAAGVSGPADKGLETGRKVYTAKCARCHPFYDPARYDDERWNTWMEKMRRKAHLNDEQYKQLSEYLRSVRVEASATLNKREATR